MYKIIGLLFILLYTPIQHFAQNNNGYYKVIITVKDVNVQNEKALADLRYYISLASDSSFTYIPLPFRIKSNYTIEPTSDNNLVMFGNIRPTDYFGVCQLQNTNSNSNLVITFTDIELELKNSTQPVSSKTISIYFKESELSLRKTIRVNKILPLSEIEIICKDFEDSNPEAEITDNQFSRRISLNTLQQGSFNLLIKIKDKPNQYILYIILGIMGILLGYFAAPKIVTTKKSAILLLSISAILSFGLVFIIFSVLSAEQLTNDTTTIVTIGMVSGLLLGMIFVSSNFLIKTKNK